MNGIAGTIRGNPLHGTVTWTMSADTARDIARFLTENITSADLAWNDVRALEAAADEVDPPEET